jgi:hypothetical protein
VSLVPVPVVGEVVVVVVAGGEELDVSHTDSASARSAASCCWSVDSLDWSLTTVAWSLLIAVEAVPVPPVPLGDPPDAETAVVVVVVAAFAVVVDVVVELEVWLSSSSVSWASSESRVDWAEETDSLRAVGSSVARL